MANAAVYGSSGKSTSTGKTLDAIAKLFGLKKMKTAEQSRNAHSPLISSKDVFDAKVEAFRKRLTVKQKELDEFHAHDAFDLEEGVNTDEEGGHRDGDDVD
jgi:hypothetical protein